MSTLCCSAFGLSGFPACRNVRISGRGYSLLSGFRSLSLSVFRSFGHIRSSVYRDAEPTGSRPQPPFLGVRDPERRSSCGSESLPKFVCRALLRSNSADPDRPIYGAVNNKREQSNRATLSFVLIGPSGRGREGAQKTLGGAGGQRPPQIISMLA